jgi:hypothetical protein
MSNEMTKSKSDSDSMAITPDKSHENFTDKVTRYNAIACSNRRGENWDRDQAISESIDNLKALNAQGGLQEMIVAQMTSIHLLQQMTVALANSSGLTDSKQYYTNSAAKLTNCFTQQATLLAKLQGVGGQKIVVEHVKVHQGRQTVVGNINGVTPTHKEKI